MARQQSQLSKKARTRAKQKSTRAARRMRRQKTPPKTGVVTPMLDPDYPAVEGDF